MVAIQEIKGKEGDKCSFEVLEPSRWKMSESKLEGVNERRLHVTKGEVEGRGVSSYFGTKVDVGERTVGSELDVVVNKSSEGSDKEVWMVIELGVSGNGF